MKLLAYAPFSRPTTRVEAVLAHPAAPTTVVRKTPLVARFVLVEDLEHLYRTGQSRQTLVLRWSR